MNLRVFYLTRRGISDGYRKSKTKPRNKNSKQIKHCNELKKPRDQQVAGLFILKDFIAFPSVWRGGKNVEINTLGS